MSPERPASQIILLDKFHPNLSRQNHLKDQLLTAATPKDRWCVATELLHLTKTLHHRTVGELDRLCNSFFNYFVDTISHLKLDCLSAVTFGEVYKLINSI
jgi:hypothetical protein